MSDSEEDSCSNDVPLRAVELDTHRLTPPPPDAEDLAEMSVISADLDEADKFELTFEIVDQATVNDNDLLESPEIEQDKFDKMFSSPAPHVASPANRSASRSKKRISPGSSKSRLIKLRTEQSVINKVMADVEYNNENRPDVTVEKTSPQSALNKSTLATDLLELFKSPVVSNAAKRKSDPPSFVTSTPKRVLKEK